MHNDNKIAVTGIGCYATLILAVLTFWAVVIYIALHFIARFW